MQQPGKAIVLFDGVCNLCSAAVQLIIRHDPGAIFRFTSLQSEQGQALLEAYGIPIKQSPESLVLIMDGKAWQYSSAALRIAGKLRGWYRLLYPLILLPAWLRDPLYRWIARNRYRWWGRKEECWLPAPELRDRFL
ncbi:thiol-disulfide oxidoreductase DCC family protein [Taibaiella helva]|uniref:thiol-disulfide oxidoreductase DCC family protein n=1 Tax=Taibaiella helva TaxID=2301235 RepID=UPI000E57DF1C|nr:thiol-disulfide oxidoreductase DCC family protein [Taibaiella helva]